MADVSPVEKGKEKKERDREWKNEQVERLKIPRVDKEIFYCLLLRCYQAGFNWDTLLKINWFQLAGIIYNVCNVSLIFGWPINNNKLINLFENIQYISFVNHN